MEHLVRPMEKMGDMLLRDGLVTPDQIEAALHEQARTGRLLGAVLVELGLLSADALNDALSRRTGHAAYDPAALLPDPALAARLPPAIARQQRIVLLGMLPDGLALGMVDPYDVLALDAARHALPGEVLIPLLVTPAQHEELLAALYGHQLDLQELLRELRAGGAGPSKLRDPSGAAVPDSLRHPIVRLVSSLLLDAVRAGASDLHFEPEAFFVRIRRRIDGELTQIAALHRDFWPALSSRLKLLAGMNIANRLRPQDGRLSLAALGRQVDFRVAALPGVHGENIVVRVLDRARGLRPLDELGFTPDQLAQLRRLCAKPEGLLIFTGPTGSGKTTALYALLQEIATPTKNVMTLEDPVEYRLPLIRQTQVHSEGEDKTGINFADGVRAILRQAPNVILIGEIRDAETAQMAVRAALTGHLVLTTLHTRDALGAIPRLLDFGLSPALLAGSLLGVVAQRLVTRTGGGRSAIAEVLEITPALDLLLQRSPAATRAEWLQAADAAGYQPLAKVGLQRVAAGDFTRNALAKAVDVDGAA